MEIITALREFGLSEKEAKIYIALSRLETAVVSDVAKKSGINRSTAYVLLEALRMRGLVTVSEKNNIQYFRTVSTSKFSDLAKANLKASEKAIKVAEFLTRALSSTKAHAPLPALNIFEGEEAIARAWEIFCTNAKGEPIYLYDNGSAGTLFDQCKNTLSSSQIKKIKTKSSKNSPSASFFIVNETIFYIPDHEEHAVLINDEHLVDLILASTL